MYKHKLLIATGMIKDPMFSQKVVFIFNHSKTGSEGVILNAKQVGVVGFGELSDLFNGMPENYTEAKELLSSGKLKSVPLHLGGPCKTEGLYLLHGYEEYHLKSFQPPEEKSEFDLGIPSSFNLFGESEFKDNMPNAEQLAKMKITDGIYFGTPFTFASIIEDGRLHEGKFRFFTGQAAWGPGQLENEIKGGAWNVSEATPDIFFNQRALTKLSIKVVAEEIKAEMKTGLKKVFAKHEQEEKPKPVIGWLPPVPPGFDPTWN